MKTVKEQLEEAYVLYDKGEWNKSLEVLSGERHPVPTRAELAEIASFQGWNNWKKGEKEEAYLFWSNVAFIRPEEATAVVKASVYAGLGIYYAEEGEKEEALEHIQLAHDLLPEDATIQQVMYLNSCGIVLAKIGELERAEEVLKKVAKTNEQLERSDDPTVSQKATLQRAKNGYNKVSLVLIPKERWNQALYELEHEVIPRYQDVGAETDEAAAWHRMSEIAERTGNPYAAYAHEKKSLHLWERHQEDAPGRIKMAQENIARIEAKTRE